LGEKMKRKILIISIFAVALLILLPISAVVGSNEYKTNFGTKNINSPLFSNRISNALKQRTNKINSEYFGKERFFSLYVQHKSSFHSWIDKAVKIINNQPSLLYTVLLKLYQIPEFVNLLNEYGISKSSLEKEISYVTNNPENLKEKVDKINELYEGKFIEIPEIEPPKPLGFSGQVGCILTFFLVVFPLIMAIGGFVSALVAIIVPGTFIVPGCLEWVFEKVFGAITEGFQGLTPP
jgi:hypothetical protein